MKTIRTAIMAVCCIVLLSGVASATDCAKFDLNVVAIMEEIEQLDREAKLKMAAIVASDMATSYGLQKLKEIINSNYYNQRPELQDAIVYELLFDFDGLTDDFETRAQQYAAYWGELKNATPVNHRYYKRFAADYKFWSDEAERQVSEAIKGAR